MRLQSQPMAPPRGWCRQAAIAPIGPLAWEPPYATGAAVKRQKNLKIFKISLLFTASATELELFILIVVKMLTRGADFICQA